MDDERARVPDLVGKCVDDLDVVSRECERLDDIPTEARLELQGYAVLSPGATEQPVRRALLRLGRSSSESAFWTKNHPSFRQAMRKAPRLSRASARDNDDKLQRKSERQRDQRRQEPQCWPTGGVSNHHREDRKHDR
jgi:hypothetical protein